ncbi:hypothetical protein StoSoilA2_00340 [Arthrobacter sp. StoSoilA2]|uniref:hypothetical protein n=1 Tax=Arthrobacter sp. StoSoilA2 TaxID=2830990 RepID=UPI001CC608FE|nr:hypothetical protein [Arthrobacter sp. StoSoilA2]BCW33978.1 hypothetical protein StoSoilA2_00340 [Arthrobacter sp. StoSoilA2]
MRHSNHSTVIARGRFLRRDPSQPRTRAVRRVFAGVVALVLAAFFGPAPLASAARATDYLIPLPGASSAEGIAAGAGTTFYAGDFGNGDIFRGDVRQQTASLFIDVPDGRAAVGMTADVGNSLLFVAGGGTGQAYVYNTDTRQTVAVLQLTTGPAFINDVALTPEGAWFTNSVAAELYLVPVGQDGELGSVRTLSLSGPANDTTSQFNLNGIAATPDGESLIVAHSGNGALYTVDPATGASEIIEGVSVPAVDGIVVKGNQLWAVQNMLNQVSRFVLDDDQESGKLKGVITSGLFKTPTTAALFGDTLAVVNAKFFQPGSTTFEVVVVGAR